MRSRPLIIALLLLGPCAAPALADDKTPPPTTATRPAAERPQDSALPNDKAPPATGHEITGSITQPPQMREMNDEAKRKLDVEGK